MLAARRAVIRFAPRCTVSAPGRARETLRQQIRGDTTFPLSFAAPAIIGIYTGNLTEADP